MIKDVRDNHGNTESEGMIKLVVRNICKSTFVKCKCIEKQAEKGIPKNFLATAIQKPPTKSVNDRTWQFFDEVLIEVWDLGYTTLAAFRPSTNGEAKINSNVTDS
ncbi:unnamed protein product [Microthlaspi erraticum]|uniref:Uncharacterized protein n=1 Tax=Microthlaspi erraticum TaxID=1685480 RepID=A0A6D2JZY9_9BRAS|nr:unnamed protein product [Microthlaspi erraticum]